MKFNIEVEATPQETRELLGLPDLRPLQGAVLARVEKQMLDAAAAMSPEGILNMWLSVLPGSSEQYLRTLGGFFRPAGSGKAEKAD